MTDTATSGAEAPQQDDAPIQEQQDASQNGEQQDGVKPPEADATEKQEGTEPPAEAKEESSSDYSAEELALTSATTALLNARGTKYTLGADRVREYVKIINGTEDFLKGVTQEQMRRIATGEDKVPRSLTERYKDSYQHLKAHWHWMKGIIAVAVAMNYEPPVPAEEPPEATPEQGEKLPESEVVADVVAAEKVEVPEGQVEETVSE